MNTGNSEQNPKIILPRQVGKIGNIPIFTYDVEDKNSTAYIPFNEEPTETGKELWDKFVVEDKKLAEERFSEYSWSLLLEDGIDIETAKRYYEKHKQSLLKKHEGKYIAIFNNKVVGSGKDFSILAQRIYKKYGYINLYMPFVTDKKQIVRV